MTLMLLTSAVAAAGVLHLFRLVFPAAPDLAVQANRWERSRSRAERKWEVETSGDLTWSQRAAEWVAENIRTRRPDDVRTYERDLAVTGQPVEEWLAKTLVWALAGLLVPVALVLVAAAAGVGVPFVVVPVASVGFAAVMIFGQVKELRDTATKRRDELCDALADFLDLVVMSMEGGRSHADALPTVAGVGSGWAFNTFYDTIDNARPNGMTPWAALGEVGDRFGVVELIDLRASLTLAHDEGTSVRETLIQRAQSMRASRLAQSQARANKSTEAMRNNLMMMALVAACYVILARVLFLFTA